MRRPLIRHSDFLMSGLPFDIIVDKVIKEYDEGLDFTKL
jgi:hypothetical protein